MPLVLAHAGHWLAGLMYAVPVFIVIGWIGITALRDRRR
jgi:hypothetical protein